jgi:two-component system, cell cycle response regulator
MDERTRLLLSAFAAGQLPSLIPEDCEYAAELKALSDYLNGCYTFALDISNGEFSQHHGELKGMLAGSLKGLRANLKHLTWQTKQIAQGDLTQRIDFLGEFSSAFNCMVESLEEACSALVHVSTHDSLTGLYNRSYFDTELERVSAGRQFPAGIFVADLNGLKQVNDTRGHQAGDQLIIETAELLRGAFRAEDVVARIGGDEYGIIMPGIGEEVVQATLVRVRQLVADCTVRLGPRDRLPLSLALGGAVAQNRHEVRPALILADERMYQDKRLQKSREPFPLPPGKRRKAEAVVRSAALPVPAAQDRRA